MFEPVEVCFNADTDLRSWSINEETQALIVAGLCAVGGWVIFSWFVQFCVYVMWPFIAINVAMVFFPSLRKMLTEDIFSNYLYIIKSYIMKYAEGDICYCC